MNWPLATRNKSGISYLNTGGKIMKGKWVTLVALLTVLSMLAGCDIGASPTATPVAAPPTDTPAAAAPTNTTAPAAGATNTTAPAGGMMFDGVTVNILTFTGPQIAEPLQRHGPEFTA